MKRQPAQCPRKTWSPCRAQLVAGGRWMNGWARPSDIGQPVVTVVTEVRGYRALPADRVRLEAA